MSASVESIHKLENGVEMQEEGSFVNEAIEVANDKPAEDSTSKQSISPISRPKTRSQTGKIPKRKTRDESLPAGKNRTLPTPRKRARTASKGAESSISLEVLEERVLSPTPSTQETPEASSSHGTPQVESPASITFLDTSSNVGSQPDRHVPRSRAKLPTPVPNLTKKSRGRRVPTKEAGTDKPQEETRLYVCTVEGCGKCFNRGEHLKRHIRSIHTYEKPFQCTHLLCDKHFNRHDNLLQHLKVHKEIVPPQRAAYSTDATTPSPQQLPSQAPSPPYSPVSTVTYRSQFVSKQVSYNNTVPYNPYPPSMPYAMAEPISFASNMAISSLRTELPLPPTATRSHEMQYYSTR
ncbi:hypothetical protein BDQ12DRAFT_677722 [Crucibulum laeve]|uniref:C2H2-type domain-containing protein n=1 Tax=Crucibulum laeve TaxID=68775 RepID=A0A5C3MCL2_9AGAR|nr:hypothetical protein BDQ12DRAFT_677722 [Crucibulum laeve]